MYKFIWPTAIADGENQKAFTDARARVYNNGDIYPAKGIEVSEEHITYMLGKNHAGNVYIEEVKEKPRKAKETKEE